MNRQAFVENIRQEIRENGFISATQLLPLLMKRAIEFGVEIVRPEHIIDELPCEDIKVIEYANWLTHEYRRKDLYYFSPAEPDNASAEAV